MSVQCQSSTNPMSIKCKLIPIRSHRMPILHQSDVNPMPIQWQSDVDLSPIRCQSANKILDQSVNNSPIRQYKVNQALTVNPWPISKSRANHPILDQSINSLQIPSIQCHTDHIQIKQIPLLHIYQSQSSKLDWHRIGKHWHRSRQSFTNQRTSVLCGQATCLNSGRFQWPS